MINIQVMHMTDVIAGIGLINLLWYGFDKKESIPVDFRIYDKETDGKTKNHHFCDMLSLAKERGLTPSTAVYGCSALEFKEFKSHTRSWLELGYNLKEES